MSDSATHARSFDTPINDKGKFNYVGQTRAIRIPPTHGNSVFHVTSVMLHMLKMKG